MTGMNAKREQDKASRKEKERKEFPTADVDAHGLFISIVASAPVISYWF